MERINNRIQEGLIRVKNCKLIDEWKPSFESYSRNSRLDDSSSLLETNSPSSIKSPSLRSSNDSKPSSPSPSSPLSSLISNGKNETIEIKSSKFSDSVGSASPNFKSNFLSFVILNSNKLRNGQDHTFTPILKFFFINS